MYSSRRVTPTRLAVGYPFCHQNIGLAASIGVRDDANNHVAAFLVELEGMITQIADAPDVLPDIGIQIHPAERGHVSLIIAAKQHGEPATLPYLRLQIGNQGAPNPAPLSREMDNQGMQLPNPRVGVATTNPAEHRAIIVPGDTTHFAWPKRLMHLRTGCCKIRPGIWRLVTKPGDERLSGLLDGYGIIRLKIRDLHAIAPQSNTLVMCSKCRCLNG
jgi:hypothetical protein